MLTVARLGLQSRGRVRSLFREDGKAVGALQEYLMTYLCNVHGGWVH